MQNTVVPNSLDYICQNESLAIKICKWCFSLYNCAFYAFLVLFDALSRLLQTG